MCGSQIRGLEATPFTRHSCKKCHSPFYVNEAGRAFVGEPPAAPDVDIEQLKQKVRQTLAQIPVKKVVAGLAALVLAWLGMGYLFRPEERLNQVADLAAKALADHDVAYLKSIAATDTDADVARWFEQVYPRLVHARGYWNGMEEVVEAHVAKEDRNEKKGIAGLSIHAGAGNARDVSLADPSRATSAAPPQVDVETQWTLDQWGHWKLDGRETLARVQSN
jgi:hypothetical protein